MASEDVIELGSSDEDTQPAPKKPKPMPNAMVCIPNNFTDVKIRPIKTNPSLIAKGLGKGVTVTKVSSVLANPFATKGKVNGKPIQKFPTSQSLKKQNPIPIINKPINNPMKGVTIMKVPILNANVNNSVKFLKNPIKIQSPCTLNLPPSITVKRSAPQLNKPIGVVNIPKVKRKQQFPPKGVGEVLTVELDDDEGSPSTSSPQWYMRPEEEIKITEEANNKEPEQSNLIEITIEDSPVKPIPSKRICEVGSELAITIDDSPVKPAPQKNKMDSSSDGENESNNKVPHSKKKLKYPKEVGVDIKDVIEIEVEPVVNRRTTVENTAPHTIVENTARPAEEQIENSFKSFEKTQTSTPKKNKLSKSQIVKDVENVTEPSEFHPVYQRFIDLCFQLEDSEDMKKIVDKKIKAYYRQVPKSYTESEEFTDMVSSKILAMKAGPEKMYLYIKDIVDELNLQRKIAKSQVVNKEVNSAEPEFRYGEEGEFDSRRRRQIRKLEKTIKKLHRAIQKLEEQEVDFDDEDDSVYLLTERYKERMVRVYAKFCQLTNTKMPSEPRIQIDARPGQPAGPAKRLEKWINKKVPIGTPLPFPDFHDVLRCVRDANDENKLNWNEADIMEEARDLFTRCGKKLQRRRQENEWRSAASRLALDVDPAEKNNDLKKRLEVNRQLASKKEIEIFNKFADRQNQLKLEAEEIGDKEAEESPVESEDEETHDDDSVSLENKEKRKERLKRLLQEKSKKEKVEKKENQPTNEVENPESTKEASEVIDKGEDVDDVEKGEKQLEKNEEDSTKISEEKEPSIENNHIQDTQSISDDSNKVESDIDELHLLQKLHSGNEAQSSTLESSDSESPIAISDTLESSEDNKQKVTSDVISIENSSYSEAEVDTEDLKEKDNLNHKKLDKLIQSNVEIEYSMAGVDKVQNKTNNDEYNDSVENILLASSDDEAEIEDKDNASVGVCVNLRDDVISIEETVVDTIDPTTDDKHLSIIEENIINEISSVEEISNNNSEEENNVNDCNSVEEDTNNSDDHSEKAAASETDITMKEIDSKDEDVYVSNIESTESQTLLQGEVMKVQESDSAEVITNIIADDTGDDSTEVETNIISDDKGCETMEVNTNIITDDDGGDSIEMETNIIADDTGDDSTEVETNIILDDKGCETMEVNTNIITDDDEVDSIVVETNIIADDTGDDSTEVETNIISDDKASYEIIECMDVDEDREKTETVSRDSEVNDPPTITTN